MPWNHETQVFDPPRDWPIEREDDFDWDDEDGDAVSGLVTALLFGALLWGSLGLAVFAPWSRAPLAGVGIVFVILAVLLGLHTYIVEPLRAKHPDSTIVDWLRRAGL